MHLSYTCTRAVAALCRCGGSHAPSNVERAAAVALSAPSRASAAARAACAAASASWARQLPCLQSRCWLQQLQRLQSRLRGPHADRIRGRCSTLPSSLLFATSSVGLPAHRPCITGTQSLQPASAAHPQAWNSTARLAIACGDIAVPNSLKISASQRLCSAVQPQAQPALHADCICDV